MATISTSQTFDSAARSAGEAFTIDSGAVFTIDSDTRDGKNAAAARAGSMSSFTMTAATGGTCLLDGTKVWLIAYDGRIGTPNVPALGTIIAGVTSGAYGELMNITSAISAVPTAAGSAMPATGYIKLKSKTGTFQDNETLEIQGSTDLCLANGVGARGWIEVVVDDAAAFTIGRAQKFQVTGDWYVSETVGSGSAHQQVQFPNYGGANFFLAGCWVDEAANGNWEFWPACITGTGTFWSASHMGTDARSKFCQCLGGGIIRFGGDGTTAWGKVPTSGAKFRVPNVFLKSAATASRASDSVPNGTLATRPDFTTTNAGQIDIDGAIGHWNINSGQAYSIRLHNFAYFDSLTISECAAALDLDNCNSGNYIIAQDTAAFTLLSNFAGGTIANCKFGRTGTIAAADYGINVQYCNGITFSNTFFANRTFRTNAGSHPFYAAYCGNLTFNDCVVVGGSLYLLACADTTINDLQYADSHHTTSSASTPPVGVVQLIGGTSDTVIDGFVWYTAVANVHPDTAILYLNAAYGVKIRNMGTYASPLSGGSTNAMLYFCNDAGNSQDLEFKRIYFNLIATTFFNAINSTKNVEITNCDGNTSAQKNLVSAALNQIIKNTGIASIVPVSTASIYGSIFYHHFTSTTAGRLGLVFSEPTAEYASYVTTNFTSSSTGVSGFNSTNGLALVNSGDYAIFVFPFTIKGIDSFQNSAPTITTATNMTIEYQIDTGSGYGGTWKTFNAGNLSGETVDEVAGFNFKIKCSANATAAANILTVLYCLTSSNAAAQAIQYPLDLSTITLSNVVVGSVYEIYNLTSSTTLATGTAAASTVVATAVASNGDNIRVRVRKASATVKYIPFETQATVASLAANVYVSQVADGIVAASVNGTIAGDFTVDTTNKTIKHTADSVVYTANELYTWLMDYFDDTATIDDTVPISAQTPTEYTLINGWFMDNASFKFISGGAIQTSGQASYNVHILTVTGGTYADPVSGDITKTVVAGATSIGPLLDFEIISAGVSSKWYVRDTRSTPAQIASTTAMTITSGTGSGNNSTNSLTGENIWSNIFTLGSLVSGTTLDVYQNDVQITPWWSSGQIDILIKVKETGTEIDSGNLTVLARKYSTLYDHYAIDASSGRNPVPLAAFTDSNNQTASGTVGSAPYTNITFSFGAKSRDLGNGNGFQPYDVEINCATLTLAEVYEYLKYVTRTGSTDTLNGVNGEYYQAVGDLRFTYSGASGSFTETSAITDTTTGATGYIVSWIDAGGNTGTLVVRNTHGTFANTNTITSGGTTATVSSVPSSITQSKQAPFGTFAGGTFFGARGVWITNYDIADSNNFSLIDSTNTPQSPPTVVILTVNGVKSAEEEITHGAISGDDNAFLVGNYLRGFSSNAVGTIRQTVDGTHTVVGEITGTFSATEQVRETTDGTAGGDTGDAATASAKTTKYVRCRIEAKTGGDLAEGTQIMNEEAATSYGSEGYYKATEVFTYTNDQPVLVRARYRGYTPFETSAVISSSNLIVTAIWQVDSNYRE